MDVYSFLHELVKRDVYIFLDDFDLNGAYINISGLKRKVEKEKPDYVKIISLLGNRTRANISLSYYFSDTACSKCIIFNGRLWVKKLIIKTSDKKFIENIGEENVDSFIYDDSYIVSLENMEIIDKKYLDKTPMDLLTVCDYYWKFTKTHKDKKEVKESKFRIEKLKQETLKKTSLTKTFKVRELIYEHSNSSMIDFKKLPEIPEIICDKEKLIEEIRDTAFRVLMNPKYKSIREIGTYSRITERLKEVSV